MPTTDVIKKLAYSVETRTLTSYDVKNIPRKYGNCFTVSDNLDETANYRPYRILNIIYENLEYLTDNNIVSWPIEITILRDYYAIVSDDRIPKEFLLNKYCSVCCPEDLIQRK